MNSADGCGVGCQHLAVLTIQYSLLNTFVLARGLDPTVLRLSTVVVPLLLFRPNASCGYRVHTNCRTNSLYASMRGFTHTANEDVACNSWEHWKPEYHAKHENHEHHPASFNGDPG